MYQAVFYEKRRNKIHIWDDRKGHIVVPYKKYAYVKNSVGFHHTLDGEKVKKVYQWDDDDPNLYESDVPITTRFLVDQYTDSDEPSEGIRTLFFDIEVEVVDGFPDVMKANEKITSIAYYDEMLEMAKEMDQERTPAIYIVVISEPEVVIARPPKATPKTKTK